jgi:D-glycero-D-manno-heptose 1,7-bisphosphate phosphatase
MAKKFPTVFIDRDGTINVDGGYINDEQNFVVYPFAAQAIRMLNVNNILAVVVTNQSGIGRGFYTIDVMQRLHAMMNKELNSQGAHVDGIYYCPHDPNAKVAEYRVDCNCRKPRAGMLEQAISELPIDTDNMTFVGDKYSDMQAGFAVGCKTIMVDTGYGKGEFIMKSQGWARQPDHRASNLLEAVRLVLG